MGCETVGRRLVYCDVKQAKDVNVSLIYVDCDAVWLKLVFQCNFSKILVTTTMFQLRTKLPCRTFLLNTVPFCIVYNNEIYNVFIRFFYRKRYNNRTRHTSSVQWMADMKIDWRKPNFKRRHITRAETFVNQTTNESTDRHGRVYISRGYFLMLPGLFI